MTERGGDELSSELLPTLVADLFAETPPQEGDDIAYVGTRGWGLPEAVAEFCAAHDCPVPTGRAFLHREVTVESSGQSRENHEVERRPFLRDLSDLGTFSYIVGGVPTYQWGALGDEQREAYLHRFDTVSSHSVDETTSVHPLYLEQTVSVLAEDGRAAIATPTVADAAAGTATERLQRMLRTVTVESIDPVGGDRYDSVLVLTAGDSPQRVAIDPETVDSKLGAIHAVTAADLVGSDLPTFGPSETVSDVALSLVKGEHRAAPVVDDGSLVGYVTRADLSTVESGPVGDHARPPDSVETLDLSAPLRAVLGVLSVVRFAFVGEEPAGLVTRRDLNSLPVYQHLYTKLANLEIGLKNALRTEAADWEALAAGEFSSETIEQIRRRYRHNHETVQDAYDAMLLSELLRLARAAAVPESYDLTSAVTRDLRALNDLRRDVAHYQPLLDTTAIDLVEDRRDVIGVAELVETLDVAVSRLDAAGFC